MTNDDQPSSSQSSSPSVVTTESSQTGNPAKANIILLSSTALMLTWKYFGTIEFYADSIANRISFGDPEAMAAFYQFGSCLALLGIVPAMIIKLVFHERLSDYGLQLGNRLYTTRSFLIAAPLLAFGGYLAAMDPGMREAFPVNKHAGSTTPFALHVCSYLLFYLGWEFHFRGFLQFGLSESMGRTQALLIQVMASSLLHIGRPFTETIACIGAGIIWGWLAYRTNSIVSGMLQHLLIGVVVDAIIIYS